MVYFLAPVSAAFAVVTLSTALLVRRDRRRAGAYRVLGSPGANGGLVWRTDSETETIRAFTAPAAQRASGPRSPGGADRGPGGCPFAARRLYRDRTSEPETGAERARA
ncbi:hypothetical protein LK07_16255 [Streptomyces pluripotens]|uniref:Uncharacterized protein n=1 Tax=Streptomyces pluripotens TaxID=1355015 RepID=A0A221NZ95_9ACTN|nr:hypothetical protein LK06_015120 [Streptomyces pluripotens]ASN25319.1 hypothetical protein LK07_16255 [Streptomyces pluripotens]KIE25955.1 hypothetical protein LK08_16150 [Streptomyces sp. MUSC 125]